MEGEQDPREARITSGSPDVGFGGPLPFLPLAAAVLPVPPPPKLIKWEEGTHLGWGSLMGQLQTWQYQGTLDRARLAEL